MGIYGWNTARFAREQDLAGECACVHCENQICMAEHELQASSCSKARAYLLGDNSRSRKKTTRTNEHARVFSATMVVLCLCTENRTVILGLVYVQLISESSYICCGSS